MSGDSISYHTAGDGGDVYSYEMADGSVLYPSQARWSIPCAGSAGSTQVTLFISPQGRYYLATATYNRKITKLVSATARFVTPKVTVDLILKGPCYLVNLPAGLQSRRYQMEDGSVVDTNNAAKHWSACLENQNKEYVDEHLHLSRKGRWYLETLRYPNPNNYCDHVGSARFIAPREAAGWILKWNHKLPSELQEFANELLE